MMSFDLAHPYGMQVVHCVFTERCIPMGCVWSLLCYLPNVASLWDTNGPVYVCYRTLHPYRIRTVSFVLFYRMLHPLRYERFRLCLLPSIVSFGMNLFPVGKTAR